MTLKGYYNRIIRCKGYKIGFIHLEDCYANYDEDADIIRIDLHNDVPPAKKFLHELIHRCFPNMFETDVAVLESKIWARLTQTQKLKLYRKLFA